MENLTQSGSESDASPCSAGWLPIDSAPKDGTEILIRIHHRNRQYCEELERTAWEGNAKARWIDHNGGGWCYRGMSGEPVMWRTLESLPNADVEPPSERKADAK